MSVAALIVTCLYMAGWIAFASFYVRDEGGTTKALVKACVGIALALFLSAFFSLLIGGAITIAATFYVADRKNRSRAWALLAFVLGPIALLILVLLPKQADTATLSLNT
jgi:uncharacterized protein YqgC (DUF456 family)